MRKFQNAKANARFNAGVFKWVGAAILALLIIPMLPSMAAHPETLPLLGIVGCMPFGFGRRGMMFFDASDDDAGGVGTLTPKQFQDKVLKGVTEMQEKQEKIEERLKSVPNSEEFQKLQKEFDDLLTQMRDIRKVSLEFGRVRTLRTARIGDEPLEVSEECARMLGAIAVSRALAKGTISDVGDRLKGICKEILSKDALTTAEIPLPTEFSGEVVELVASFGTARRFGTVFPLPGGTMKLPKLTTDPTFGPISMSAAIAQKQPAFVFVTFAAEKWGGLVILPNEIDEDSIVAVGQFVARYAARQMASAEDRAFWIADGSPTYENLSGLNKLVADNNRVVTLGGGQTHHTDIGLADVRLVRSMVDTPALSSGRYFMHQTFEQFCCGLNQGGDKPYVANGANGATLDGFKIEWIDVMPTFSQAANVGQVPILFGDASFHYLGVRGNMRLDTSDAPGFATDQLYIRALERFTTGLMADGAMGGLRMAGA
jgi:HK97 family phage major capsid protein